MKRDRLTFLADQKSKMDRMRTRALSDAKSALGVEEFADDLQTVAQSLVEDVNRRMEVIQKVTDDLEKKDIMSMISETDADIVALRRVFVDSSKDRVKAAMTGVTSAISAFKTAVRKVQKAGAKLAENAETDKRPLIVQKLSALTTQTGACLSCV